MIQEIECLDTETAPSRFAGSYLYETLPDGTITGLYLKSGFDYRGAALAVIELKLPGIASHLKSNFDYRGFFLAQIRREFPGIRIAEGRGNKGASKKWIGAFGTQLIREIEAIKAGHKRNAGCDCGEEDFCRRCELSDAKALESHVRSAPLAILKRFLKEKDWKALLNSKGQIKAGADLMPTLRKLAARVSESKGHRKA